MSSEKLAIYLVLGIVIIVAIVFGVYMLFFRKKNGMSGAGSFDCVFKNANTNLKEPVKKLMSINDDQFSFFIAGVFSATCLSKDDFKKIFEMKEDNDEEKKKTKASLENLEKAKDSLVKFLGLKEESEIKKSISEVDQLNLIKDYATEEKEADVSKKDSEPFKNIIENIKKVNNKESEALNKNLSDKKKYSMVEVVVCGTTEIFKKCISASA